MPEPDINPPQAEELIPFNPLTKESLNNSGNPSNEDEVLDRLFGKDEPEYVRDVEEIPSAPDLDLTKAIKALKRDGVPSDVIDGMASNPSKLKEWGLKSAKRQADVDSYSEKLKAVDPKKPSKSDNNKTEDGEDDDGDDGDKDPLSSFEEIFGGDAAKPLRTLADQLRAEFSDRSRIMEVKYETQGAYLKYANQYGKSAPSLDEITEVAATIGRENPGKFSSVEEVVAEAFLQRVGHPVKIDPRNAARPTVGKAAPRVVQTRDREDVVLDILLSGGSKSDALKALSR